MKKAYIGFYHRNKTEFRVGEEFSAGKLKGVFSSLRVCEDYANLPRHWDSNGLLQWIPNQGDKRVIFAKGLNAHGVPIMIVFVQLTVNKPIL